MFGGGVWVAVATSCPSGENATPTVRPHGFITPDAVEIVMHPPIVPPPLPPEFEGAPPAPDPEAPPAAVPVPGAPPWTAGPWPGPRFPASDVPSRGSRSQPAIAIVTASTPLPTTNAARRGPCDRTVVSRLLIACPPTIGVWPICRRKHR